MKERTLAMNHLRSRRTSAVLLITVLASCSHSCATRTDLYPETPDRSIGFLLQSAADTPPCEFRIRPPQSAGWMMMPGKRGPKEVHLKFLRYRDKLRMARAEVIMAYSLTDTTPFSLESVDNEALRTLLADYLSWSQVTDQTLTVAETRRERRFGREFLAVDFTISYKITVNAGPSYDCGLMYVMKSPCDSWSGLLVFTLLDTSVGKQQDKPCPTQAAESFFSEVIMSLVLDSGDTLSPRGN